MHTNERKGEKNEENYRKTLFDAVGGYEKSYICIYKLMQFELTGIICRPSSSLASSVKKQNKREQKSETRRKTTPGENFRSQYRRVINWEAVLSLAGVQIT